MRSINTIIIFVLFLFHIAFVSAQETVVLGTVRNKTDKTPIQSVNIYFKGTKVGVESDKDGFYVIRHTGEERILVFSCIGYKTQEFKVKRGQTAGLYVELRENINSLQDFFVLPGANPALDLMQRVRESRYKNDVFNFPYTILTKEQQSVLLNRNDRTGLSSKEGYSISEGMLAHEDSNSVMPLYTATEEYFRQGNRKSNTIPEDAQTTPDHIELLFRKLMGEFSTEINFYHNTVILFGKQFISPLASSANAYYRFFLIDSLNLETGKQYFLRFRSKNDRNLAFNGELWIDSATHAMTKIKAELPAKANINYIRNLKITQHYQPGLNRHWFPETASLSSNMTYQLLADSADLSPDIYLEKKTNSSLKDSLFTAESDSVGSPFSEQESPMKSVKKKDTPLIKTAKWIADGIMTGYVKLGKLDLGKIYQIARLTDIEGARFSLPLRTNELLWRNFSVGGYWGYGFGDKKSKYAVNVSWKLPLRRKTVISSGYTDDLRRIDYDYNDFLLRESPMLSGDEDLMSTYLSFISSNRINPRKEFYFSLAHDWNEDIESKLFLRRHDYTGNSLLPLKVGGADVGTMRHHSVTLMTRFSYREKTYEDHLDRIYITNNHPVLYLVLEAGEAAVRTNNYPYAKINARLNHKFLFSQGVWHYILEGGWIFGKMPYNLLWIPFGGEMLLFDFYQYNMMNHMEYVYDKYVAMHHEWSFNGILFNHIPGIRELNLRELVTLKCLYGGISPQHTDVIDFPTNMSTPRKPYVEIGIGFSNIFRILSVQSVWRLTDTNKNGVHPWQIKAGLRLSF